VNYKDVTAMKLGLGQLPLSERILFQGYFRLVKHCSLPRIDHDDCDDDNDNDDDDDDVERC
jgi:hypothetical protein